MANTIGTAYIQIEPSAQGIQGKLAGALDGEAESAGKSAGGKLSSALSTALKVGAGAIAGASAAVVGFGKSAVDAGSSFDSSMAQVAATMGVTVDSIGELRDFAQQMGSTTAFSASEAADALNYMALAGYDAETSMSMLPNVLNLAAAGGIDLASASDMVTDASSALGLSLEDTSKLVDQMAKTSSKSNTSVAQLGEAILTVGGTAKNLSGGTVELSKTLGVLADNGIKGAEAGTHLRNIMLAMNPTTDAAAAAWEKLGVSAYDSQGNLRDIGGIMVELNNAMADMSQQEKTETLSAMFNKTDLSAVNALMSTTIDRYGELSREIIGAGFNEEAFRTELEKTGLSFEDLNNAIDSAGQVNWTGDFLGYLEWAQGDAERLAQALYEDADSTVEYQDVVNLLGGDLSKLQEAFDNAGGAAKAMADTQLDNLAGDVTLFQSALEGAKIAVSDQLTPTLREFVQFGADGLSQLTEAFNQDGLSGMMTVFGQLLSDALAMIIEMIPEITDAAIQLIGAFGEGLLDNLPMIINAALEIVLQLATAIGESLPELIPAIIDTVLTIADGLIDNIDLIIDAAIELIVGLALGLAEAAPKLIEKGPEIIQKIIQGLIRNLPKILAAAVEIIIALASGLIKALPDLILRVPEIIAAIVKGLISGIKDITSVGKDIIGGLWEGIKKQWANLVENVSNLGHSLVEKLKGIFKIGSPSKLFRDEIGQWIPAGIAVGIDSNLGTLDDSMSNIQSALLPDQLDVASNYAVNYDSASANNTDALFDLLSQYLPQIANMQVVMDTGATVGVLANPMNSALGKIASRGANR